MYQLRLGNRRQNSLFIVVCALVLAVVSMIFMALRISQAPTFLKPTVRLDLPRPFGSRLAKRRPALLGHLDSSFGNLSKGMSRRHDKCIYN